MSKRAKLLVGFLILVSLLYLWLHKPWLPYTEPEIQQILLNRFPHPGAGLQGFIEETENCRIARTEVDSVGIAYVMVMREDDHWVYVDHAFKAGGLLPMIECPR